MLLKIQQYQVRKRWDIQRIFFASADTVTAKMESFHFTPHILKKQKP